MSEGRFIVVPPAVHAKTGIHYPFVFCAVDSGYTLEQIEVISAAIGWCYEQVHHLEERRWQYGQSHFYFSDEDDAFAFRMRWC